MTLMTLIKELYRIGQLDMKYRVLQYPTELWL
jgi:hypothetical protein